MASFDTRYEQVMLDKHTQSLGRVTSGRGFIRVAVVGGLLLAVLVACLFVPWQQVVVGTGKVMIMSPQDRPQTVEAQLSGRIDTWHVQDGQTVEKGQLLVTLKEIDTKYLDPNLLPQMQAQQTALQQRIKAATLRMQTLGQQQQAVSQSQANAVPAASQRMAQAAERAQQAVQTEIAARQALETATYNRRRIFELNDQGLRSRRDRELAELDFVRAQTELERAKAALQVANRDVTVAQLDRQRITADTNAGVLNVGANMASAQETIAGLNNDAAKLSIDIQNIKNRIAQRRVLAPAAGRIVRLNAVGQGQTVGEGDPLATIAPTTADQAVALTLSDNDIPLVREGAQVRLQFAGWPAIQFTGWPAASVGTFAGRVTAIDAVDDGKSKFRIIVQPDTKLLASGKESLWPKPEFLRPGGKVLGWVMLNTVPLWFELWRQFNAFPPNFPQEEDKGVLEDGGKKLDTDAAADKKADSKATKRKAKNK
jgi:membrane fusion protein, adhesin transport system